MTEKLPRTSYSEHTANKIRACIRANPGLRAKEIANRVELRRETVNSYLYSLKPGALGEQVFQDANYGWHLRERTTNARPVTPRKSPMYSDVEFRTSKRACEAPHIPSAPPYQEEVVFLSLVDAFQGVKKTFSLDGECMVVDIPPRIRPGTKLCVKGSGFSNSGYTQKRDLYLRIEADPNAPFHLAGNDVICDLPLASTLAEQGGTVQVLSPDGIVSVTIPPGLRSGQSLRVVGKGWEDANGERGYLYLKTIVSAPEVRNVPPIEQTVETEIKSLEPTPEVSAPPPRDREEVVRLALTDAFQGIRKKFSFDGECIVVDIPAKTRPGTKLCIKGKGFYNSERTQRSDLYLQVEADPDDLFRLVGNDVMCDVTLSPDLAEQGGKIQVSSLDGTVAVTIPRGLRSGQSLRLIGKGWESSNGERGDLYLKPTIIAPEVEEILFPSAASSGTQQEHFEVKNAPPPVPEPATSSQQYPDEAIHFEVKNASPPSPEPATSSQQYSVEAIQQVFRRDDFNELSDEEQGRLAQMLEEAEQSQREKNRLVEEKPKSLTLTLRSPWFWVAVLLGAAAVFTGMQVTRGPLPLPSAPIETQNR